MSATKTSRITQLASTLLRAHLLATVGLGVLAIGLAAWIFQDDNDPGEDGLADDDIALDVKPLGALGVSDSAASMKTSDGAPLILPGLDQPGLAENAMPQNEPLFAGAPEFSSPVRSTNKIETAGFELAPPPTAAKTGTAAPRVTANQAVWLSGTIEFDGATATRTAQSLNDK